jgi:hypothetical protein
MGTPYAALCSGPVTHSPSVRSVISLSAPFLWPNCAPGFDNPHVTTLLPDQTVHVHDIESQEIAQVVPPPPPPSLNVTSPSAILGAERRTLATSPSGFLVPLQQRPEKLVLKKVNLLSRDAKPGGREEGVTDEEEEVEPYDL